MSDDDGMVMNFTTDSVGGSSKVPVKVRGGRWTDRRKMKAEMSGRDSNVRKRGREDEGARVESSRYDKQSKTVGDDVIDTDGLLTNVTSEPVFSAKKPEAARAPALNVNSQMVTSLFTSNREINTLINLNNKDDSVIVAPSNAPLLENTFESLGISDPLLSHLKTKMRIEKPTSIQKLVLPHLLSKESQDLFIHAQTGSGKTLAYLLPVLAKILNTKDKIDRKSGCFALILAPTRELASQIYQVLMSLTSCCHYLVPCLLIGGEKKKSEKARLRKGCNFIVGTPGRVLDHFGTTQSIKEQLSTSLRFMILDEGDKLMELGFEETLNKILDFVHGIPLNKKYSNIPSRIVHLLCSATNKGKVTKLGNIVLENYKMISNAKHVNDEDIATVPDQLVQKIVIVPPKLRLVTLASTLDVINKKFTKDKDSTPDETTRTIVFLSCSDSVEYHYEVFSSTDRHYKNVVGDSVRELVKGNSIFPSLSSEAGPDVIFYKLHGSLSQQIRTSTLQHFSKSSESTKGKHLIMFCTDVASRGLDLPQVGTVIELDPPFAVEDHLHRIGRTARAGKAGESILFLLPGEEEGYLDYIKPHHTKGWKLLDYTYDFLKPSFQNAKVARNDKNNARETDSWDTNATTWHLNVERRILEDSTFKALAVQGFTSHIRAYATHISKEKQFFNVKFIHIGHLAKSFGLRETPKYMGAQKSKAEDKKAVKENPKNKMFRLAREAQKQSQSEFNY